MLAAVGNTPVIRLDRVEPRGNLFGKAEFLNPTGSVKDRAAARMIESAMSAQNRLTNDKQILDSSSGNTGISLAAFGAALGFGVTIVIPKSASLERQKMLRLLGASIIFSDPLEGADGAILVARELVKKKPESYYYIDQYSNEANWRAHYHGTAEEIWRQTEGQISHFVAGVGTGGTIMGTGRRLKELNPKVKVIAVQPTSPFHGLEGLKHMQSSLKPRIFDQTFPDQTEYVETEVAQDYVKILASRQGILAGTSSGATVSAARKYSEENAENRVIVVLADNGSRYMSERYLS